MAPTVFSYLHYEVEQSKHNPQCQSRRAISILVAYQVTEPQWDRGNDLVELTHLFSKHQQFPLETEHGYINQ